MAMERLINPFTNTIETILNIWWNLINRPSGANYLFHLSCDHAADDRGRYHITPNYRHFKRNRVKETLVSLQFCSLVVNYVSTRGLCLFPLTISWLKLRLSAKGSNPIINIVYAGCLSLFWFITSANELFTIDCGVMDIASAW